MSNQYPPPPPQDPDSNPDPDQPPPSSPPPPPSQEPQWNPQSPGTPGAPGSSPYGQPQYGQPPYGQPPQYGQPPPYGPPPPGAPGGYGPSQKTSPLAITSLVLGIVGIPCCTVFALGIAAVVTGFLARKQIAESQGFLKGDGMAMAGLVLGVISIVVAVVVWILNLTGATDSSFYFDTNA